jgi:hydrogenase-4 component E
VNAYVDLSLVLVLLTGIYVVYTSRLEACIKATAIQGAALGALPFLHFAQDRSSSLTHAFLVGGSALLLKAALIPYLLLRAMRAAKVKREVQPFVSTHVSVLIAAGLVVTSFVLPPVLALPLEKVAPLYMPTAFATLLLGFLVIVTKRTAILQVVGYLLVENGAFVFGQSVAARLPFVVELGVLLDLLVGVFVMGIVIHSIGREFDHIDVEKLNLLKG